MTTTTSSDTQGCSDSLQARAPFTTYACSSPPARRRPGRMLVAPRTLRHVCGAPLDWGRRIAVVAVLSIAAVLAPLAAGAHAEPPHLIKYGSFHAQGYPQGIAVDQATGDVYVSAFAVSNINKFEPSGTLLAPPSPFSAGSEHFSGTAVNPVNGDVYALDSIQSEIDTFDPSSGALLSSFPAQASNNLGGVLSVVQIASDSSGNVYVPVVPEGKVIEYSSTGAILHEFTGGAGAGALDGPNGVAVDSAGDLWVADTNNNRIEELSPADTPLRQIESAGVQNLALDGHGQLFALVKNREDFCGSVTPPCSHLVEYSTSGVRLADVGAALFESGTNFALLPMVAVHEADRRVYVTDMSNETVWIFGPPLAPTVTNELTAEVTGSEAKLGATVNPGGIGTSYRFEYGTTTAYGHTAPLPEGSVGEGLSARAVWASASGLAAGTTYHYRVVATSEVGTVAGPDHTFTTLTAEQVACPNERFRAGFSAELPDCRAYELVTPPAKTSVEIVGSAGVGAVAADGNAIEYQTLEPIPGAPTGSYSYMAARGSGGWNSEDVMPLQSYSAPTCASQAINFLGFSDVGPGALVSVGMDSRSDDLQSGVSLKKQECNVEGLQVVAGEPVGYVNLLMRNPRSGSYSLVNAPEPGLALMPANALFQAASSDFSDVVFTEKAQLTADAPVSAEDLYEWDEGVVRLASVLPDGTPSVGSLAGSAPRANAVSAEGPHSSHVVFEAAGSLYVRIDGERTVQLDETHGPGSSGGGAFQAASSDGSTFLFTDTGRLTADSTAQAGEPDLYQCVLAAGASKCQLRDLTVAAPGEHADVTTVSMLGSRDDTHAYFVAKGVLAANKREHPSIEGNTVTEQAQAGQLNLYMWNGATTTFIAAIAHEGEGEGFASPDGTWFAFNSSESLTGYDNIASGGSKEPVREIYLFDAATMQLVCASCNPSGEAPAVAGNGEQSELIRGRHGGAAVETNGSVGFRPVSGGGRLFFLSDESLVPSDTNGQADVYEYHGGQLSLITSGTSSRGAEFLGASESGDDVFFLSAQQLVPQDTQPDVQLVYDARVGGGLPAVSSPPACTTADGCRAPVSPQPSIFGAPSSQTFAGAGNLSSSPAAVPAKPRSRVQKKRSKALKVCQKHRVRKRRASCTARARKARVATANTNSNPRKRHG